MVKKICGIYKIENLVNGKVYIGQSSDMKTRFRRHKNDLNRNNHYNTYLQNSYNKYGKDSFKYTILEEYDESVIDDREIYWINYYNSCDENYGYNMETGGHENKHHSDKTKLKMSLQRKGKNHPNYGKHLSEETRNKISEGHSGKTLSKEHKQKLRGRTSSFLGRHHTEEAKKKISEARKGKKNPHSEEAIKKMSLTQKENRKKVKLTDEQVIEIREKYATGKCSLEKIAEDYPVCRETIRSVVDHTGAYDDIYYDPYKNINREGEI